MSFSEKTASVEALCTFPYALLKSIAKIIEVLLTMDTLELFSFQYFCCSWRPSPTSFGWHFYGSQVKTFCNGLVSEGKTATA